MKRIYYDGVAAETHDDIANAVLELALAVARYRQYELVTFPVVAEGRVEDLTLMVGPTIHVSTLSGASSTDLEIDDPAEVVERIRQQAARVSEPLYPFGNDLDAWLTPRP